MLIPVSASFSTRLPFTGAKEPSSRFSRPQLWLVGVENRPERCFAVSSKVGKRTKLLVPKKGLEPPHPCGYMDLNHARLPIPPLRHEAAPSGRTPDVVDPTIFTDALIHVNAAPARNPVALPKRNGARGSLAPVAEETAKLSARSPK